MFEIFTNPSWLLLVMIIIIIGSILIAIMQILRYKHTLLVSILLGLICGIILAIITTKMDTGLLQHQENEDLIASMISILLWPTEIFLFSVLIVVPFYIFTTISTTFTNTRHNKTDKRIIVTSFFSLWGMSFLGILVAILLFPLMLLLKDLLQLPFQEEATNLLRGAFFKIYGYIVLSSLILSIIFATIMNSVHKRNDEKGERLIAGFVIVREKITSYLKFAVILIPYVMITRFAMIFNNYDGIFVSIITSMGLFILIFFLGLLMLFFLEFSIVYILGKKRSNLSGKEIRKLTSKYTIESLAIQSAPVMLPITKKYVHEFKTKKIVEETTPTFSTFMGFSMCGGFYPALIVFMTIIQIDNNNFNIWIILFAMIPVILLSTLGMTGVPGADVASVLTVLSILGLPANSFGTIYLLEGFLDKFRGIGNSMGFAAATMITNSITEKYFLKKQYNYNNKGRNNGNK